MVDRYAKFLTENLTLVASEIVSTRNNAIIPLSRFRHIKNASEKDKPIKISNHAGQKLITEMI